MYLEASILTKESKNAFRLPRRAILKDDKVFIVDKKNKLRIKKVNIITYQGDEAIIDNIDNNILVVIEPLTTENKDPEVIPKTNSASLELADFERKSVKLFASDCFF